nr:Bax inhibitor-1 family protein [Lysinibacillus timonensis]
MAHFARNQNIKLILQHFLAMWVLTVIGLVIGSWLSSIVTPLSIICLILIFVTFFMRSIRLGDLVLYVLPFLMGILLLWVAPLFSYFFGNDLLITVFICTVIIFIILGVVGLKLEQDIPDTVSILFTAILTIVVFSVVFIFFAVDNTFLLLLAAILVLFFAVFTVYTFNSIRRSYIKDADVVWMALNLYFSLINLLANLSEVAARMRK